VQLERRGFEHIPESERGMTLRQTGYFWIGTNANLFFVSVGVIALGLGLSIAEALIAVVLGTLLFAVVALASIGGARAGLPTMTFTRAVYGGRGNAPHAALAWLTSVAFEAINCIFGVLALLALAAFLGWEEPGATGKGLATAVVVGASAAIAIYGHAMMVQAQRAFAVVLTVVLIAVLGYALGDVDWDARGDGDLAGAHALPRVLAAAAVIAAGPISYLYNAADWVRYLPSRTSGRAIFWTVFGGSAGIALLLSGMGVLLASGADMSDPIAGVEPLVPGWLFVLFVLAAVGGSIANNVVTYYSSGLCLQSLGLPLRRHVATAVDVTVATAIVVTVLFVDDFTTLLHDFVALMVVWLGPFAAVWITDGVMRRWKYDPEAIHGMTEHGERRAWTALLAGMLVSVLTINAPILHGPVSEWLGGADLTWTLGPLVSAAVYWGQSRRSARERSTAAARVSTPSLR